MNKQEHRDKTFDEALTIITIATILICCREAIDVQYPATQFSPFVRTAESIKFLHGAADALRVYKRVNESGIINDVIAGIKRDGLEYLYARIREAQNMRDAVTATKEYD